jgi:hypothetical protein
MHHGRNAGNLEGFWLNSLALQDAGGGAEVAIAERRAADSPVSVPSFPAFVGLSKRLQRLLQFLDPRCHCKDEGGVANKRLSVD